MSFNSTVLGLSPLDFFRFSETSGTTATNLATVGRPGTYKSSVTLNVTPGLILGESATPCVSMAGGTTFTGVAVANPSISGSFTVFAVIKATRPSDGLFSCILGSNPGSGHGRFVFSNSSGGVFSQFGSTTLTASATNVPAGTICVVAMVNDSIANTQKVYLNGVLDPTTVVAASGLAQAYLWGEDFDAETDYKFNGQIAAGALFASALTTAQIKSLTAAAIAQFANPANSALLTKMQASSPAELYVFNEAAGLLAQDFSANALHASYVGSVGQGVTPGLVTIDPTTPCISFPGGDDVTVQSNGVLCPAPGVGANSSFTIMALIAIPSFASETFETIYGSPGGSGVTVNRLYMAGGTNVGSTGQLEAEFGQVFTSTKKLTAGIWHIAFVNDETNGIQAYYINGVLDSSMAIPGSILALGQYYWGQFDTGASYKFLGDIAYGAVYPSALSAGTILQIANTALAGALTVSPTSLTFATQADAAQQLNVSRSGYVGNFYASASGSVSVSPTTLVNGSRDTYFIVAPTGSGSGSVVITDDTGASITVPVTVGATGSLGITNISSSFVPNGSFTVTESLYDGPFTALVADPTVANIIAPSNISGPGPIVYEVVAVAPGVTTITVTDNHGGSASFSVAIDASASSLTPNATPSTVSIGPLQSLFPKRWAGSTAWNNGADGNPVGILYSLMYPIASALSAMMLTMWPYVRLQTRLATAEDEYVTLAWQDFYRNRYTRNVGESNSASTTRLRQKIIAPTGVKNGVLDAVQQWFLQNPDASASQDVFDKQTDPIRSAYYGIQDSQFAVILYYAENIDNPGFFVGQSFLGQDFLTDPYAYSISQTAPYPGLAQAVNDAKDLGYRPVYITSHGENPLGRGWGVPWWELEWSA